LWPEELDDLPRRGQWPQVTRADVKAIARRADGPEGAAQTYVAAAVWGTGTKARGVERRCWPFTNNSPEAVGKNLAAAVEVLRTEGPVAAYDALQQGALRLRHLGPAFFTKVTYFAGHSGPVRAGELRPLIIDQYVVRALNALRSTAWPLNRAWSTKQYATYLDVAHGWAASWGGGADPELVEATLFTCGRSKRS
jgi:hypothetical protein